MFTSYRTFLGLDELPEGTTHAEPLLDLCSPLVNGFSPATWGDVLSRTTGWLNRAENAKEVVKWSFDTARWLINEAIDRLRQNPSVFADSEWLDWEAVLDDKHWRLFVDAVYAQCVILEELPEEHLNTAATAVIHGNAAIIAAANSQAGFALIMAAAHPGDGAAQTEATVRDAIEAAAKRYRERQAA